MVEAFLNLLLIAYNPYSVWLIWGQWGLEKSKMNGLRLSARTHDLHASRARR